MSQEQPPFGLLGPILAEIQRRPRSRIKFNCPPSVVFSRIIAIFLVFLLLVPVSYTHLTLPTKRIV